MDIKIEWNILGQDKKSKWTKSTLLSSVSIKDGYVFYSYSNPLRKVLFEPNIYAKLDLNIQKDFKYRNTVLIWEFIQGELSVKKETSLKTKWLSYKDLLRLTFLEDSIYKNRYSDFINKIMKKIINEINNKSDILVDYELKSVKGKIEFVRFIVHKKAEQMQLITLLESEKNNDLADEYTKLVYPRDIQKKYSKIFF